VLFESNYINWSFVETSVQFSEYLPLVGLVGGVLHYKFPQYRVNGIAGFAGSAFCWVSILKISAFAVGGDRNLKVFLR